MWKERAKKREEKKARKAAIEKGGEESEWLPIDGAWAAYAINGKGHHDGDGKYTCRIPVEDFGEQLFLAGEARIVFGTQQVFRLPSVAPPPNAALTFQLQVDQRVFGGMGRLTTIDGIEVRARSQ